MTPSPPSATLARKRLAEALIAVGRGDRSALSEVYGLTCAKLFGICLRICGNREEAEEVVQEVYVKVWQRAGRFDPERASPITWLAAIARNSAIDRLRARPAAPTAPIEAAAAIADDTPGADAAIEDAEQQLRMRACLDALEGRTASAIRAAFFGGLTYAQLAERDAVPLGTMKTWIRRGLLQLRSCLGDG
ncbi:sigma-70 family RNA polymerase sigma factor [Sphingomonas sp. J315]|uniref:sigma-70 family RNA polymerase sigma factor n=1 Tax=Sphingomonas sp. J315 TaxID=2898433 RepID=UPI0021513C5B|nr:sigma-70 family RNA polymerase sigma factor [Sphingomonas sp. J315]MCR5871912.1 sigma-70 family RNA polymerase sigma factor [Sphingomonas sp. J344]UUX99806.1 sigma-70 family RNA polymerase sigma factor [Sphingomonas sp. J315]